MRPDPVEAQLGLSIGHEMAELAADRAGEDFKEAAFDALVDYARRHADFTTEDVRRSYPDLPTPPDLRAWGQVALRARRDGIVRPKGFARARSRSVHGMIVTRWASNICEAS